MVYCFALLFLVLSTANLELDAVKLRLEVAGVRNHGPHRLRTCLHQTNVDAMHKLPSKFIFSAKLRHLPIGLNHNAVTQEA